MFKVIGSVFKHVLSAVATVAVVGLILLIAIIAILIHACAYHGYDGDHPEKFEFTTQMPKSEILKTVETIPDNINEDYIVKTYDDGFSVAEKAYKGGLLGTRNSFVPVGKAKICEKDDTCTVSVSIRMHIYVRIFCCIYLLISSLFFLFGSIGIISSFITAFSDGELLKMSVICLCFLPLFLLLENSAFRRPAKRMKELLTSLLERE